MRDVLRNLNIVPDLILVSSARRTLQTLEALEPWDETPLVEPLDSLYLATAGQLLATVSGIAETVRSAMVIGHNPGLHEFALALLGDQAERPLDTAAAQLAADYPTGALAEFTVPVSWRAVGQGGTRLERFIDPRDLGPKHD